MLEMLASIGDFLQMLADTVTNLFSGVMSYISLIPVAIRVVDYSIAYMPPVLTSFAFAGIGICVVFHIIGR